jgi:raffinose/stachyose/melibiose transport system permease protein
MIKSEPQPNTSVAPSARASRRRMAPRGGRGGWLYVLPALAMYALFVLWPLITNVQYSLYDWDGITDRSWVGLANYARVLTDSDLIVPIVHAFQLIFFFTVIPVFLGLVAAALIHGAAQGAFGTVARTTLFLPQVSPLVAAGIAWKWAYSSDGVVNQLLSAIGLGALTRSWLADFDTALPAVGVIGTWVMLGFCTVLLLTGMSKIDSSLYEAARIDGAGPIQEFRAITVPSLIGEIGVCATVSMIAALASFDIIYITTLGGPGTETMVPGVLIYRLAFTERNVGLAAAMSIVLMVLVVVCVIVIQRLTQRENS